MKFESITMENFMRYKGRNHIEFSCDDVKNVTVVLGDNTVGKTTIAQAFRWGLYGALMANGTKSAGDFQLLNTDILEMMDANSRAKVKVEIAAVDEEKRYIITRETTYTRAFPKLESREFQKKCAMRITELEDMESYVEVDSNEIETLINELFPKNLSHYFLFDGERWNDVSVGGVRENIKESVHILTGLSAYREAKNHLKDMGSNSVIKKFRSEIKGSGAVYDNLEAERKKLERDIEKLRDEIEVLEVNIRNYEKKNEDIERFLAENHNTEELQRKKKHLELLGFSRGDDHIINSALNYGYAIVRGMIARSIICYGLEPSLGLFHSSELNSYNLADDFIEVFRPVVDLHVSSRFDISEVDRALTPEIKRELYGIVNYDMLVRGEKHILSNCIDKAVASYSSALQGNREELELPVLMELQVHRYE